MRGRAFVTRRRALSPRGHEQALGGLPKNFIRPCLLLLIREESAHGYDLLVKLDELGVKGNDPGGLYRTLRAMEQEGLVLSAWEPSELGPARRTYELTEEGEEWLHAWAGTLRETGRIVAAFLRRYDTAVREPATRHPR